MSNSNGIQEAIFGIEKNPSFMTAQHKFQEQVMEKSAPPEQLKILQKLLQKYPDHFWLKTQFAIALSNNGDHDRATEIWSAWFDKYPSRHDIQNGLWSSLQLLPPKKRITVITPLLEQHHTSLFLQEVYGISLMEEKRYDESVVAFRECLDKATGDELKTRFGLLLANAYQRSGDCDSSVIILRQILAQNSKNWPGNSTMKLGLCKILVHQKQYDAAIQGCIEGVQANYSKDWDRSFIKLLGDALHLKNKSEITVSTWTQLFMATQDTDKLRRLSDGLGSCKDSTLVIHIYKKLLETCPNRPAFHIGLCHALEGSKNSIDTTNTWKELLMAHPSQPEFLSGISRALGECCESPLVAISTWKDLLIAHPEQPHFYGNLRDVLDANGNDEIAEQVWKTVTISHSSHPDFLKELRLVRAKRAGVDVEAVCIICLANEMDTVFYCGHPCCSLCAKQITRCHECREDIEGRIKVFARMFRR